MLVRAKAPLNSFIDNAPLFLLPQAVRTDTEFETLWSVDSLGGTTAPLNQGCN